MLRNKSKINQYPPVYVYKFSLKTVINFIKQLEKYLIAFLETCTFYETNFNFPLLKKCEHLNKICIIVFLI